MPEQVDLEYYRQQIKECLMTKYNYTADGTEKLMMDYGQILLEYYDLKLTPNEMAFAITMNY